ncbi:MAG: hypothetical protein H0U70_01375 [Tatlockia sp.]|nr:hypothetical protein [Tatlockia sp.]MBA3978363.1 hypothetical protein [Nitrosopumilus sp.]
MPQISDLLEKRKFQKKAYRAWDLSGTGSIDGNDNETFSDSLLLETKNPNQKKEENLPTHTISVVKNSSLNVTALIGNDKDNKSGNETDNTQLTNNELQSNKEITELKQSSNERITTTKQLDNLTGNLIDNTEKLTYYIESIKRLSGIQKNIFLFVINMCTARGMLDTGIVLSSDLANASNCSLGSAKTSLNRLIEKQLVTRLRGKSSRGGYMVLGISNEIQAAALQAQRILFNPLKTDNNLGNIIDNSFLHNSSNNINTNTNIPYEWEKIDTLPLQHIGFSDTQIRQLFESKSTVPDIVQDSINRFAYSLENNDKIKNYTDPLNVLMGVLRKGQRWNEPNYLSPKEIALRQMLEESRSRKEQEQNMIKELIELEFPDWRRKLTEEEINKIVPQETRRSNFTGAVQSCLRTYFTENVIIPKIEKLK